MRTFKFLVCLCVVIIFTSIPAKQARPEMSNAFGMDGVSGYIQGRAQEAISRALSKEGTTWLCDAIASAVSKRRQGGKQSFSLSELFAQDETLRFAVKEELRRRIREWLPKIVKEALVNDVFGGLVGEEATAEIEDIAKRIEKELDTSLNDRIDEIAGKYYNEGVARLVNYAREHGVPPWMDITDLKGTIGTAFTLDFIGNALAIKMGEVVGDATVQGIRGRISDALNGQLPPEIVSALERGPKEFEKYVAEAQKYLPGNALETLTNSVLNRPLIKLPTPAYASMLAASAAGHFAKAYGGAFGVNMHEIQRGLEVTRVMIWQVRNREAINLSLMQMAAVAKDLASAIGIGAQFDDMLSKFKEPFEEIQRMADDIDKMVMKPVGEFQDKLRESVEKIKKELQGIQERIAGPVREQLQNIDAELKRAGGVVAGKIPDEFNGIPGSWADLKDRLGARDGLMGEAGDWAPRDVLDDLVKDTGLDKAADKFKKDMGEVADKLSETAAEGASQALEALHFLGPTARILGVEYSPPKNAAKSDKLDPVLLHNGEFEASVTDLMIPGRGIPFKFTRTYRGNQRFLGELGQQWTYSFAERLLPWNDGKCEGLTYIAEDGRKIFFCEKDGMFILPKGVYSKLVRIDGGFEMRATDGLVTKFNAQGRPIEKRDRHGNSMQYEYGADELLAAIRDALGREIKFIRRADGLIEGMQDFAGRQFKYEYNGQKELTGVTTPATPDFPKGKTTGYRYARLVPADGEGEFHLLEVAMDPNGRLYLQNTYNEEGKVVAQRYGGGQWMRIGYQTGLNEKNGVASRAFVTDKLGVTRAHEINADGQELAIWRWDGKAYHLIAFNSFNGDGEIARECDENMRCTVLIYNDKRFRDRPTDIIDVPNGNEKPRRIKFSYEPRYGRVELQIAEAGLVTHYSYYDDETANLASVRVLLNGEWIEVRRFASNAFGDVVEKVDGRGSVTRYEYSPEGFLQKIVESANGVARTRGFTYDPMGNIATETAPDGTVTRYTVNALNQIVYEERAGMAPVRYVFDANDNVVKAVFEGARGEIAMEFAYDELDNLLLNAASHAPASGGPEKVWRNGFGEVAAVEDGMMNRAEYERDKAGRIVAVRGLDAKGKLLAENRYEYDGLGRMTAVKELLWRGDASSQTPVEWRYEYDMEGGLLSVSGPNGIRTFTRDLLGNVVSETDEAGGVRKFEYDRMGRLTAQWQDVEGKVREEVRLAYGANGRPIEVNFSSGETWRYAYDDMGNLAVESGPAGMETRFEYDDMGRRTTSIRMDGKRGLATRYAWNMNGRMTSLTDAKGNTTKFGYDAEDRLISEVSPDGTARRSQYDADGNLSSVVTRDGSRIAMSYDKAGRLIRRDIARAEGVSGTTVQRFEYDGLGRLVRADDNNDPRDPSDDAVSEFAYDSLSRPVAESHGDKWIRRDFDDASNVIVENLPSGLVAVFERDASGRLAGVMAGNKRLSNSEYGLTENIVKMLFGNGAYRTDSFDPSGRLFRRTYEIRAGVGLDVQEYHHDDDDLPMFDVTSPNETKRIFGRDALGRLVLARDITGHDEEEGEARSWRYKLDDTDNFTEVAGNGAVKKFEVNGLDQYASVNGEELRYDTEGRLLLFGGRTYSYDALGRLTAVLDGGVEIARYAYDAFDRRVSKIANGKETRYIWDGWRLAESVTGGVTQSYFYNDGAPVPFAVKDSETESYLITDRQDSVRGMIDAKGDKMNWCSYSPYGEETAGECRTLSVPFGWTGQMRDDETGLIYMRERYYDPKLGRFLTPDPLGFKIPLAARGKLELQPAFSYHRGQNGASHATFANRALTPEYQTGAFPFGTARISANFSARTAETNLYAYAKGDPSRFTDPLGLAALLFDRSDRKMTLYDRDWREITLYRASNNVTKPEADPFEIGGYGPFPAGTYSIGVPDFISEKYRNTLYERFGFGGVIEGESSALGETWSGDVKNGYNVSFGQIRIRAGWETSEAYDGIVWMRELFLHGGQHNYKHQTNGCIRTDDLEMETLAANMIAYRRQGDAVDKLIVQK